MTMNTEGSWFMVQVFRLVNGRFASLDETMCPRIPIKKQHGERSTLDSSQKRKQTRRPKSTLRDCALSKKERLRPQPSAWLATLRRVLNGFIPYEKTAATPKGFAACRHVAMILVTLGRHDSSGSSIAGLRPLMTLCAHGSLKKQHVGRSTRTPRRSANKPDCFSKCCL